MITNLILTNIAAMAFCLVFFLVVDPDEDPASYTVFDKILKLNAVSALLLLLVQIWS